MPDDLENAGMPDELLETQVLSRFAQDPNAKELHDELQGLFQRRLLKVYKKDKNLLSLVAKTNEKRDMHPIVDKTNRLIFVLGWGTHQELMAYLYAYECAKKGSPLEWGWDLNHEPWADKYIQEGLGYYFSGADSSQILANKNMVYGVNYQPDKNDQAVFATYADKGQKIF